MKKEDPIVLGNVRALPARDCCPTLKAFNHDPITYTPISIFRLIEDLFAELRST